jgi:hypothetical protein
LPRPDTSLIKKAKRKDWEKPVRKRLIPITMREINTTFLTPKRAARKPPMMARERYPIKFPIAMEPSCV